MKQMIVIIDGIKTCLLCNIITRDGHINLNPVAWGTDVLSIQDNGKIEHRQQGADGDFEQFVIHDDFVVVTTFTSMYAFKFLSV
jgi:hypothetical protein